MSQDEAQHRERIKRITSPLKEFRYGGGVTIHQDGETTSEGLFFVSIKNPINLSTDGEKSEKRVLQSLLIYNGKQRVLHSSQCIYSAFSTILAISSGDCPVVCPT